MRICPHDLERCDRTSCDTGLCKKTGEVALTPCVDCGALISLRGLLICFDCVAPKETAENH